MSRVFAQHVATMILEKMSDLGQLTAKPVLKADVSFLAAAALKHSHSQERQQRAWQHLICDNEEDLAQILAEANGLHSRDELFENAKIPEPR